MNGTKKLSIYCVNASSFNMFKNSIDDVTVSGSDACMYCHSHTGQ